MWPNLQKLGSSSVCHTYSVHWSWPMGWVKITIFIASTRPTGLVQRTFQKHHPGNQDSYSSVFTNMEIGQWSVMDSGLFMVIYTISKQTGMWILCMPHTQWITMDRKSVAAAIARAKNVCKYNPIPHYSSMDCHTENTSRGMESAG